jgi:hypothetical protein
MQYEYGEIDNVGDIPENCITVIIPTIHKSDRDIFMTTLNNLTKCKVVKRVIIINSGYFMPPVIGHKIFNLYDGKDYFVNPAWNIGMNHCESEYFLLLNDDVLCHENVLKECIRLSKMYDVIFMETRRPSKTGDDKEMETENKIIKYITCKNLFMTLLSGCFIFGKRSIWKPIPEQLKVFFGDNWILDNNRDKAAKIISTYVIHLEQQTVRPAGYLSDGTLGKEQKIYDELIGWDGQCSNLTKK